MCCKCERDVSRAGFSDSQWLAGSTSKCKECVSEEGMKAAVRLRTCRTCGIEKCKDAFSKSQWSMAHKTGSQCQDCSQQKVKANEEGFRKKYGARSGNAAGETAQVQKLIADKTAAERWVMEASELALPSENLKSYQAMHCLRSTSNWCGRAMEPDDSGIPAKQKLSLLQAVHEELSHMGNRDGIVKALQEEGKSWRNVQLDAQFIVSRCERCRKNTQRGLSQASVRHLPTPGQVGVGFLHSLQSKSFRWEGCCS